MPTATEPDPAAALPEGCDRLLSKENVAATSCGLLCDKQAEARLSVHTKHSSRDCGAVTSRSGGASGATSQPPGCSLARTAASLASRSLRSETVRSGPGST